MPQITVQVGTRDHPVPAISKGTPLGALPTLAVVHLGQLTLSGAAAALRPLGQACTDAADMADGYDAEPDPPAGQDQREGGR